jgi:hypothetical protein
LKDKPFGDRNLLRNFLSSKQYLLIFARHVGEAYEQREAVFDALRVTWRQAYAEIRL